MNGSLGTGFKESSLEAGLARPIEFIGVDSGSTDGGPFYLGSGEWIWSTPRTSATSGSGCSARRRLGIPLIIGSCGGGGNDTAVDGYARARRPHRDRRGCHQLGQRGGDPAWRPCRSGAAVGTDRAKQVPGRPFGSGEIEF